MFHPFIFLVTSLLTMSFNDGTIDGVNGKAMLFDGISSRIVVDKPVQPEGSFIVDVWVCPVSFPKSPCPIVCQQDNYRPAGYSLWLDARGRVHFKVANAGFWISADSEEFLELKKWSRITAYFRAGNYVCLAVNGKEVASTPTELPKLNLAGFPMWIGRTPVPTPSFYENKNIPIYSSFDGAIDELNIVTEKSYYRQILEEKFVRPSSPEFETRVLPKGPENLGFGAWYVPLNYYKAWDNQWRGELSDVVVSFGEENPSRVVFWRGISYAPCFVTEKNNWMCNEFIERLKVTGWGCPESMSDKHADFSSVRIVENTSARTVVVWRNAPVGVNQKFPFQNEETKWGDWSEETYIFYPDGVGVRKMDVWSDRLDEWYEWCQSLQVLHPGQCPEDVLDSTKIMSVAAMDGRNEMFPWRFDTIAHQFEPTIEGANIQVSYLNSEWNPFLILDDRDGINEKGHNGPEIVRYAGRWSKYSAFPWRNHWPVTQDYVIGRYAAVADAASHTYTATQYNAPYYKDDKKMTKLMLCGCTRHDAEGLLPLAKSWLRAPKMTCANEEVKYDVTQRVYRMQNKKGEIQLYVHASKDNPICGLCLIIDKWEGKKPQKIKVNGEKLANHKYRVGIHEDFEGEKLVVWLNIQKERQTIIKIN